MKRSEFKFEVKILILLVLGLLFVSIIGIVTYKRLNRIVTTLQNNSRPEVGLLLTHVIQNDVNEMSNIVRSRMMGFEDVSEEEFTITKLNLLANLYAFKQVHQTQGKEVVNQVDSLINQKILVSDELFYSEDAYRVQKALSKVVKTIGESLNDDANEPMKVKETVVIKERIVEEKEFSPPAVVDDKRKKKLFGNKKSEKARQDSIAAAILAKTNVAAPSQSIITTSKKVDTIGNNNFYNSIYDGIRKVREEELAIESRLKDTNYDWISLDENLERELNLSFNELKRIEREELSRATVLADQEAHFASRQIMILAFVISLLLFGLGYLTLQYTRRNFLYREAIQRSTQQIKEFAVAREHYMSNISHELRTPMHAIQGFAELLAKEKLDSSARSYVKMIQKSSQHMGYLINDVLDLAKLRSDKIKVVNELVCLSEVLDEVWNNAKQLNHNEFLNLELYSDIPPDAMVEIDAYRLRQVLLNLLSNAIKFTKEGFVKLKIRSDHSKGLLIFQVQDSGIGMSAKELDVVFDEFTQANEQTAQNFGGTGLGLTITKKIIDLLGGTLKVESAEGKGTVMIFTLPISLKAPSTEHLSFVDNTVELIHRPSILIVDDEAYNRKFLEGILMGKTKSIFFSESAEKAMKIVENEILDLILLDFRLPGMNGVEFVKWIHEQKLKHVPKIIVLSAAIGDDIYDDLLAVNVDGVLGKPFTSSKLFQEINNAFETGEMHLALKHNELYNFEKLRQLFGQDKDFYVDMLQTYISSSDESIHLIKLALREKDCNQIGHEAHKMASPTKHLGANELYSILKLVESESVRNDEISFFIEKFDEIERIYKLLKKEILLEIDRIQEKL